MGHNPPRYRMRFGRWPIQFSYIAKRLISFLSDQKSSLFLGQKINIAIQLDIVARVVITFPVSKFERILCFQVPNLFMSTKTKKKGFLKVKRVRSIFFEIKIRRGCLIDCVPIFILKM